jgi:formylglycine-generating enzyme required for sulfatase activity
VRALILAALVVAAGCRGPGAGRTDQAEIRQVWVPPGSFTMGSTDDEIAVLRERADLPVWVARELASEVPAHTVRLMRGFWIDRDEVTNAAFQQFVAAGGYGQERYWSPAGWSWLSGQDRSALPAACPGSEDEMPRRCVSWYEAEAYARWRGGRLPTEAEWEYAARGPRSLRYPWGSDFDPSRCNVLGSTGAAAVGSYPRGESWVGAQDMAGNAMEWAADWLGPYAAGDVSDPPGPATGTIKVEKGGWWGANAYVARAAYRHYEDPPVYGDKHIGFRIVTDDAR